LGKTSLMSLLLLLLGLVCIPTLLLSKVEFQVSDHPSDNGTSLDINWNLSNPEQGNKLESNRYITVRVDKLDSLGAWIPITEAKVSSGKYSDNANVLPGQITKYRLVAKSGPNGDSLVIQAAGYAREQWFNINKLPLFILILVLSAAIIYYILASMKGKDLFIRKINGLESMDEAVGRATEKGKPILFVPGIGDLDDIQTIAGLTILSQLAYKAATYNADILVPVSKSMVLSTAREIVKEAYLKAGKPDAYKQDCVFYLTDDQFGYVAGIDGIMVREQPAANFFLGTFYAEALILAETGFSTGAMQTAGTAQPHQLPFFVVSCDYTLIGEELFAASAYLSKAPDQLGSLKGQDFGKLLVVLLILTGVIMEIAGYHWLKLLLMVE
jgi:hypothetical protein